MTIRIVLILLLTFVVILSVGIQVLYHLLVQSRLSKSNADMEVDRLQSQLENKVRDKIELTQRSKVLRKQKDELIATYIYKQDIVQELGEELKTIHIQEYSVISGKYPQLTDLDLLVLCLLSMDMTNDEICELVHMEKRTLYRRRQLIAQRIGIPSTELEQFANENIN